MKAVAPIVVQAEAEVALPGLAHFVKVVTPSIQATRKSYADARISGWNVARQIFEYSARADVQARVKALNTGPDGKNRPGRPRTAHGLVMDHLAQEGVVTRRTIEKWVYEWHRPGDGQSPPMGVAQVLKLKPACSEKDFLDAARKNAADTAAFVESTLEALAAQSGGDQDDPEKLPPTQWADKVAKPILRELTDAQGQPKVVAKARLKALAEKLDAVLDPFGWAVAPKAKH